MATSSTRRDRPRRYTDQLEVHLDARTQTKITGFVTALHRPWSEVLRHLLRWGLTHGQGWQVDRGRRPASHHIVVRLEPELRQRVREAAPASGGDISAWLRHAVRQVTMADFPTSWQAARREPTTRGSTRSHDSRHYHTRYMMRLDDASTRKLDELAQHFNRSAADVLRQLIAQAKPRDFPKSWQLWVEECRQQKARQANRLTS